MRACIGYRVVVVIVLSAVIAGCGGAAVGSPLATQPAGYPSIDALIRSCNASSACSLPLPPGTFVFSTQVAPRAMFALRGAGASGPVANPVCRDVFVRAAASVEFDILQVERTSCEITVTRYGTGG